MRNEHLPKTFVPFVWFFIKKQWKRFTIAQVCSFAWSIDHTFWPLVLMMVIDKITNFTGDKTHIWSYLATPLMLGLALWIGIDVLYRICGFVLAKAFPQLEADIRMSMVDYVQYHSYDYFSNHLAGSIANKISDITQNITRILQLLMVLFLPVALTIVLSSILFFFINPFFAAILLTWLFIHLIVMFAFSRKCADYSQEHSEARSQLSGKIVDMLSNINSVRLFARHRYELQYLSRDQHEEQSKHQKSLWYSEKMKLVMSIVSFLGAGLAMNWYMLYSWQQGYITTGEVVFIFNTTWNITIMAWLAALELPNLYMEIGICKQAMSIIQDPHDIVDEPHAKDLQVKKGEIVFENVSFHYLPEYDIFQDKNITIHAGEKVGLVGFSGSGKSTFVHLILRYYDVERGRILIDGQDITTVTQDSIRRQIAFIPQDTSLFHRTMKENIQYGRPDASLEEIITASQKAHCEEFIEKMPEEYDALVGERGVKLSGGQRQRIAIARAVLKDAPILILDEATSALDSVTERLIQEGLTELMEGRTTIVIAHRLSTLSGMDRILVFHEGKIIEEGTHEELLRDGGHYAKMWEMQAGGFLPEDSD
jgi:ATP-binding cassette subfamily B protein